ncbi:hypothetical protein CAPTEDRAFT_218723 [Capitella teleta]|uniref:DUF7043 domain-containing protein n=1 Tax=Capitella teleta TaxID=283909 RepID=X2ANP9_CAPTE|nr:hypothetical protein CAPTEDRAFT_218723 [Capitella teleta]|eukprot:ELT90078.1 hypothetical protein CAPTEDRAFT_218723 [Capitella teleta]
MANLHLRLSAKECLKAESRQWSGIGDIALSGFMMPSSTMTSTLIFVALLTQISDTKAGLECHFPNFMQSNAANGIKRDWRSHLTEGGRTGKHWELALGFYANNMRSSVLGGIGAKDKPYPFTRLCLDEVSKGRFMVEHQDHGATNPDEYSSSRLYLCMEFIHRSSDVVQIRESRKLVFNNPKLCSDESLEMSPWIVVNKAQFFSSKVKCPLTGGFNMKVFDKLKNEDICSGYSGATRLESECMVNEGMLFRFRHDICIPAHLKMHEQQHVFCMANWEQGGYTFSVIRADKAEHVWCFRLPANTNGAFQTYLFRDGRCEMDEIPQNTNRYLRIALIRNKPRTQDHLCVDDYEACSYWNSPCVHAGSMMQLTCARKCGICSDDTPRACTLPSGLRGRWFEHYGNSTHDVTFDNEHFNIEGFSDFNCVQWYRRPYEGDVKSYKQMFVTTFENGCYPRYTCAEFKKHSPSVIKFRLSQSEVWPWDGTTGVTVNCDPFRYHDDDAPLYSEYHSRHLKVLVSKLEKRVHVQCGIPGGYISFQVMYRNGTECRGEISEGANHRFHLTLQGCEGMPKLQSFGCLDSTKHGYLSKQIIVSETLDATQLQCWMFPESPHGTFFLLPFEECNEGARERIADGQLQPLATFSFQPPTSPVPSTTPAPIMIEVDSIVSMGISRRKLPADGVISEERTDGQEGYRIQDNAPGDEEVIVGESKDTNSAVSLLCVPQLLAILTWCSRTLV